ncbi:E3 ubiquitin-protein ligase ATL4 [Malania oleifera]|uniref:E3 ubiquitin-protein ligase ATL4 n=1 Tax=Malania oleifera TaxID=397392 RepID=UPI0025AE3697|nr:E3 ubiquitin-protein ligase ATL4 [Malania oleifera]
MNPGGFAIAAFVISGAVIVTSAIYFLLRLISNRCNPDDDDLAVVPAAPSFLSSSGSSRVSPDAPPLVEALPAFTFSTVTGAAKDRDCAICLAIFQPHDRLRLLPICCHAFHAGCIDAWLVANQTCPLCRCAIHASESDIAKRLQSLSESAVTGNESFRVEIGNVSLPRRPEDDAGDGWRSFSIGSLRYVVDEESEIAAGSVHRAVLSDKDEDASQGPEPPGPELAGEVARERSWLREYVERLASTASSSSFRSSSRFFTGSSRRTETPAVDVALCDLEANRIGHEISEMFRWFSSL